MQQVVFDLKDQGYLRAGPSSSKYVVASFGSSDVVLMRGDESEGIDHKQRPSCYERVFADLKELHGIDHPKGGNLLQTGCGTI